MIFIVNTALTHFRWDWVNGGWLGTGGPNTAASRAEEYKLQRRRLQRKLLNQMHELETGRDGASDGLEEQQVSEHMGASCETFF